jgi:hypothetical protein
MLAIIGLISCNIIPDIPTPEENDIIRMAYSDTLIYAEDFYSDPSEYSVYYVNTISVTPTSQREHSWIDLATDDYQQARAWMDSSTANSSVDRNIYIGERETNKFFEFIWDGDSTSTVAFRVHKLSYFEPIVDRLNVQGDTMGIYHGNMSSNAAKEFAEYMFYRHRFCNGDVLSDWYSKILESDIEEHTNYYSCVLKTMVIVGGDWGISDMIHVFEVTINIDKDSGYVTFNSRETRTITGHMN